MSIQKRSIIAGIILAFAFTLYGAAKHYSPSLILYVVQQSLIQKAPAGTDTAHLQNRLRAHLSTISNQSAQMRRLLQISEYLEKVQRLTLEEMDKLLAIERP
jgi:hypothetical protein